MSHILIRLGSTAIVVQGYFRELYLGEYNDRRYNHSALREAVNFQKCDIVS